MTVHIPCPRRFCHSRRNNLLPALLLRLLLFDMLGSAWNHVIVGCTINLTHFYHRWSNYILYLRLLIGWLTADLGCLWHAAHTRQEVIFHDWGSFWRIFIEGWGLKLFPKAVFIRYCWRRNVRLVTCRLDKTSINFLLNVFKCRVKTERLLHHSHILVSNDIIVAVVTLLGCAFPVLLLYLCYLNVSSTQCFVELIVGREESLPRSDFLAIFFIELIMIKFKVTDTLTKKLNRILQFARICIPVLEFLNLF